MCVLTNRTWDLSAHVRCKVCARAHVCFVIDPEGGFEASTENFSGHQMVQHSLESVPPIGDGGELFSPSMLTDRRMSRTCAEIGPGTGAHAFGGNAVFDRVLDRTGRARTREALVAGCMHVEHMPLKAVEHPPEV